MSEEIRARMKTGEDFARAAAEKQIPEWRIGSCSMCGYATGYVFDDGMVGFDRGCHCTGRYGIELRTWDDVAAHYNMQTHPRVIAEYDAFWGFTAPSDAHV